MKILFRSYSQNSVFIFWVGREKNAVVAVVVVAAVVVLVGEAIFFLFQYNNEEFVSQLSVLSLSTHQDFPKTEDTRTGVEFFFVAPIHILFSVKIRRICCSRFSPLETQLRLSTLLSMK